MTKSKDVHIVRVQADTKKNDLMREDLTDQLQRLEKFESYFVDMIEDYIDYVNLKDALKRDIKRNGIRYKKTTGNGFQVDVPNESVRNLQQVTGLMLKILHELGLQEPELVVIPEDEETTDDFY